MSRIGEPSVRFRHIKEYAILDCIGNLAIPILREGIVPARERIVLIQICLKDARAFVPLNFVDVVVEMRFVLEFFQQESDAADVVHYILLFIGPQIEIKDRHGVMSCIQEAKRKPQWSNDASAILFGRERMLQCDSALKEQEKDPTHRRHD